MPTPEQIATLHECTRASHAAEINFPEVVRRLSALGVERYHTDYSRSEVTYYFPDGDSLVVPSPHEPHPTGNNFSAAEIQSAIRQSQREAHTYRDFVRKTMTAGCIGYFVQITGRRAIYFGRNGESHTELFPSAP